ncbi:2'-5' RNA ligase family protein [Microaerobacter geothermalis]|uniref:2'-5' RNA ligase family protein n=1 Tax=Microaerobacter geothermalis TaxID=674972 RepID=UPI001F2E921D|nr:2'-5' RNA ligase family protein [Microaerobacter geothermalis]MCF6094053.1 2'-5' RNA ligase family protein [Microaerobacter geothermalis]
MKYGIVIFPNKNVQDTANSYRKRYDSHYALIPPHLTLIEAFEADDPQIKELTPSIKKITENTKPFILQFHKVSTFHPTNPVIYFAIKEETEIIKLHQSLRNEIKIPIPTSYRFIPHLTIGQDMSTSELLDVYGRLRMNKFNLETYVDRIHLVYQLENETWSVYQTFLLGEVE